MRVLPQANISGKRVLIRVGFNVPMHDGNITDDRRIRAALPTIKYCIEHAKQVILVSHLGRPKGIDASLSLQPIAQHLQHLLRKDVQFVRDFNVGDNPLVLLENIRFWDEEKKNEKSFAQKLASLADVFVCDAFADMHRAHASISGVAQFIPGYAGYLVQKEVTMLERVLHPDQPFVTVFGFAKIADKLALLENMLDRVDRVLLGGAVIFTFFKAANVEIGKSLVEEDQISFVEKMLRKYGSKIQLPTDIVVGHSIDDQQPMTVPYTEIPADMMGLDVGPASVQAFADTLSHARTVFWNGPIGVFEHPPYDKGTVTLAQHLAGLESTVIVGGGDTASAAEHAGVASKLSHVSTGGGASLAFLGSEVLPGLRAVGYYD